MGSVRLGIDLEKVLQLHDRYDVRILVETGSYKGGTARLAAPHFDWVYSIEAYRPRYDRLTAARREFPANITFLFGDSRIELARILATANAPTLCWLDAHWCGEGAHDSAGDECPLLDELAALKTSAHAARHVLMIDDARLFTAAPPYPHDPAQWPSYAEIERLLAPRRPYILDDVIYAEPAP